MAQESGKTRYSIALASDLASLLKKQAATEGKSLSAFLAQITAMFLSALVLIPDYDALGAAMAVGLAETAVAAPIIIHATTKALACPVLPVLIRTYAAAVVAGGSCLALAGLYLRPSMSGL